MSFPNTISRLLYLVLPLPISLVAASTSSQYTSSSEFQSSLLYAHNFYRTQHNATSLTWNTTSATFAASWASPCNFQHSDGPTGENIAAGYPNATSVVDAWVLERLQYDFAAGDFSSETGHFTQVVWKATTSVGCGRTNCTGSGGMDGWFVVCEYYPPGNVIGEFKENVQSQVSGSPTDTVESAGNATSAATTGVTASATATATATATAGAGRMVMLPWEAVTLLGCVLEVGRVMW
jgi:hypothetical protein